MVKFEILAIAALVTILPCASGFTGVAFADPVVLDAGRFPDGDPLASPALPPLEVLASDPPETVLFKQAHNQLEGRGTPANKTEADRLFRKAAEMGHAGAAAYMGGIATDVSESYYWYTLSIRLYREAGNKGGYALGIDDLRLPAFRQLTAEQRAEIDRRVAEWKPAMPE